VIDFVNLSDQLKNFFDMLYIYFPPLFFLLADRRFAGNMTSLLLSEAMVAIFFPATEPHHLPSLY